MQDLNPLPWGAQDRFQAHFIVKGKPPSNDYDFMAETKLHTKGHFGSRKLEKVEWIGGRIAEIFNNDNDLANMILKLSIDDAHIKVDPTKNGVRIYSEWKSSHDLQISKELFAVYDRIALLVKQSLGSPPIKS